MSQPTRRRLRERRGFWYGVAILLLRRPLRAVSHRDFRGGQHLPAEGGVVLAVNHISPIDPLFVALYTLEHGRLARFLAKDSLFSVPVLGHVLTGMGHLPVYRGSTEGGRAVSAAVEAARAGRCVVIYPEATITDDPDGWPMVAKTGAARIALAAGVPLVPMAQWGVQDIWPAYSGRPRLTTRHRVAMHAGPPIDLSEMAGQPVTTAVLRTVTDRLMDTITSMLADIRHETPPAVRFDPRTRRPDSTDEAGEAETA